MQKFVIVSGGRTGSNLLCGILDQHPLIACHYEVLSPKAIYLNRGNRIESDKSLEERDADPIKFLENLYAAPGKHRALGFKLLVTHDPRALNYCLTAQDIKKIILTRRNLLAQYSSQEIGNQTQEWLVVDQPANAQVKVTFQKEAFLTYVDSMTAQYESVEQQMEDCAKNTILKIEYADLAARKTVESLFTFVGVQNFEIKFPTFKKQNTSTILDRFNNPDDVLEVLTELDRLEWARENVESWRESKVKKLILNVRRRYWAARRRQT